MKKIHDNPARFVLVQQTEVKKGLFRKATVDAAAIGDENGKALTPYAYDPGKIGEYDENGLVLVEQLKHPGRHYLNLEGKFVALEGHLTVCEDCLEFDDPLGRKGLAAKDGTILIPAEVSVTEPRFEIKEQNNVLERFGKLVVYGYAPTQPRPDPESNQLGAGVLLENRLHVLLQREYNYAAVRGKGLLAAGRYCVTYGTEYKGITMVDRTGYLPVFNLYSPEDGTRLSPLAFTGIVPAEGGNWRAVVIPGVQPTELRGKGGSLNAKRLQGAYEVTLDEHFKEISERKETRTLVLE